MKLDLLPGLLTQLADEKSRFTRIYLNNGWRDRESRSGPGSRRDSGSVRDTIQALERAVRDLAISSIADIPCGDFNWMPAFLERHADLAYLGFDIVDEMIADNARRYPQYRFEVLNVVREVPPAADLVLCKDLLNHLRHADVERVLDNLVRSGSRYLLASNNFGAANNDLSGVPLAILIKGSRPLDITRTPFRYPRPIWRSHYLGLWRLSDLRP